MDNTLIELSSGEWNRYTNQIKLCEVGLEGQKKLKSAAVAVIGAGGLGCASLLYLAAAGIGKIGIIDHDLIDISNLQRQILFQEEDLGELKCEAAKKKLSLVNPHSIFNAIATLLTKENANEILQHYDIVIDATDNFPARYAINDACMELSKPFIYGSIHHFEGQIALLNALESDGKRGPDYRSLYPIPPAPLLMPSCAEGGVMAPLPGIIGSIQAMEAIKWILNIGETLSGKLLKIDSLTWNTKIYQIGCQHRPKEEPIEINAGTLQKMLLEKMEVQLVDLRENTQNQFAQLGALSLPFSKLLESLHQIHPQKTLILFCEKGIKSLHAAKILRKHFKNVYSLQSGVKNLFKILESPRF